MTNLPAKLKQGDNICVISPSAPVTSELRAQLESGTNILKRTGLEVVFSKNALVNTLGYSATPQEKADDINKAFADKSVKAIICSQGGSNANSILPLLDYDLIRDNPKIFLGISDITVLLNAIYYKTGLITFHGNDVIWGLGRNPSDYDINEFIDRLFNGATGKFKQNSKWQKIKGETAEGILLGGNLHCLTKLAGTQFFPDFTDKILFLEEYGESDTADSASYEFHQLEQIGVFKQIKGLWLGHYKTPGGFKIEDIA